MGENGRASGGPRYGDREDTCPPRARHLVLLGLPGAGKSTVGPLVAEAMGRGFVDLDELIEATAGRSIASIFAELGEGTFREMERDLTRALLEPRAPLLVVSPGGGWVETAANRSLLGVDADAVYLRVSPGVAVARMGTAAAARPLLASGDPAQKVAELHRRREPFYLQSRYTVSTDSMTAAEVASSIVALASGESPD